MPQETALETQEIAAPTWRQLEEKIRFVIGSTDAKNFRTLTVSRPDGSVSNYSSWTDLAALLKEVVARRREEDAGDAALDSAKQYGYVNLTAWGSN